MVFGRRRKPDEASTADAGEPADGGTGGAEQAADAPETQAKSDRTDGPWDVSEVDLEAAEHRGRIDLGALLLRGADGMQLQLQVEEQTQQVTAALVVVEDSAVQLLAVAAPRSTGVWEETRAEMSRDARRRGATVEEAVGPFGPELRVLLPVQMPDGGQGVQPSRHVGIDGPRWLLRATFLGEATTDDVVFERLAAVVRDTVVVRGDAPMPPGDLIPMRLPEEASPPGAAEAGPPSLDDLDPGPTITEIR